MKTTAVIGANFGDEGKGLMTDYFSAKDSLVVRYNGGAQAGHTVVTPDGKRHVFGHFGSGSFVGAATFLGPEFLVNPLLWKKELNTLRSMGIEPKMGFSHQCRMTLPYDMLINEAVERARGNGRHGSCGLGINETVTRCLSGREAYSYPWIVNSLTRKETKERIISIRDGYCRKRIKDLGLSPDPKFFDLFNSDSLLENFLTVLDEFTNQTTYIHHGNALEFFGVESVVFEGAQGLLLDEDHEFFPHVTRSKTGLKNILELCKDWQIEELDVVYATRAYMTRHGVGPFPSEDNTLRYEDKTNVHNEFQGSLRFGRLDIDLLSATIKEDLTVAHGFNVNVNPAIAITCVDQVPDILTADFGGRTIKIDKGALVETVADACGIRKAYFSEGPTREHVSRYFLREWVSAPSRG